MIQKPVAVLALLCLLPFIHAPAQGLKRVSISGKEGIRIVSFNTPEGKEQYPVVHVSREDARVYAEWAGKRLPAEKEYAAQAGGQREWPWKQKQKITREKEKITHTLTVYKLKGIDSTRCNTSTGQLYPVGKYPWGLEDLVGSVWQLTHDL